MDSTGTREELGGLRRLVQLRLKKNWPDWFPQHWGDTLAMLAVSHYIVRVFDRLQRDLTDLEVEALATKALDGLLRWRERNKEAGASARQDKQLVLDELIGKTKKRG